MYRLIIKPVFIRTLLIVAFVLASSTAFAADFQKGWQAYQQGDYETALNEWLPVAEQGNSVAQYNLGNMYNEGTGVPQDFDEAVKWYRKAAEQGFADAQYNLGNMYNEGTGVPQDFDEALKWHRKAAEQGFADAQNNLGVKYNYGQGVPQDYVLAHMWFNLSGALGYKLGAKNRDLMAKKMPPSQIAEAQKLAKSCLASYFKNC